MSPNTPLLIRGVRALLALKRQPWQCTSISLAKGCHEMLAKPGTSAELAIRTLDFGIVQDIRKVNGRPESPLFDKFWSELKTRLESHARVDDRRHGACSLHAIIRICVPCS